MLEIKNIIIEIKMLLMGLTRSRRNTWGNSGWVFAKTKDRHQTIYL